MRLSKVTVRVPDPGKLGYGRNDSSRASKKTSGMVVLAESPNAEMVAVTTTVAHVVDGCTRNVAIGS